MILRQNATEELPVRKFEKLPMFGDEQRDINFDSTREMQLDGLDCPVIRSIRYYACTTCVRGVGIEVSDGQKSIIFCGGIWEYQ